MAGKPKYILPDPDTLQRMLHEKGVEQVAREIGMSGSALSYRARKMGLRTGKGAAPNPNTDPEVVSLDVPKGSQLSPEKLLRRVGLDPAEWQVMSVKAREGTWGNPDAPNEQIRLEVTVKPKLGGLKLPELKGWQPLPKPKPRKRAKEEPSTSVVISDHHAPHNDKGFHALFVEWLADDQPDLIEVNGDLLDFADISRHRTMPATGPNGPNPFVNTVNECLQVGFGILADYRRACPDAEIRLKFGNHDARLYYALVDNLKGLYDITPANDDVPALSLRKLLRLDELHVELVEQDWERARTRIGKHLTALHGYSTTKNPGGKILTELTGSTLQGHSHRLSLLYRTSHHADDGTETRLAGETGCACEIDDGLGYANAPDWQQGAMLVKTWSDNDFTVAPIIYLPGRLLLPDGRRYVLQV
jgi:hypothetical protein